MEMTALANEAVGDRAQQQPTTHMNDRAMINNSTIFPAGMADPVERRKILPAIGIYLSVAFAMAWSFWLVGILIAHHKVALPLMPILVIGSFGPFVGALVTTWWGGGWRESWRFFARAFDPRMGWAVFLVSFFLLPLLALAGEFIHAWLNASSPQIRMHGTEMLEGYLFLFVFGGTLAEEYGWSLLSDKLDGFLPLKLATFVLGLVWSVWHLPLFFIVTPHATQGYTPFYIFLVGTTVMRFLFAWAYHRGRRNILSQMLFHTASNMAVSIVALAPSAEDMSTGRLWTYVAMTAIAAIILWIVAPPEPAIAS